MSDRNLEDALIVATKQAQRSPMAHHRTGAAIYRLSDGKVVSRGCSHPRARILPRNSVHAEEHALRSLGPGDDFGVLVVTLTPTGAYTESSRPCASCVRALWARGVREAVWPSRLHDSLQRASVVSMLEVAQDVADWPYASRLKLA